MMDAQLCSRYESDGTLARYVALGRTDDAEDDFERHVIGCERCQAEVRMALAIRAGLSRHASKPLATRRRNRATIAALALAAGLGALAIVQTQHGRALRALGEVGAPPEYAGIAVRRDAAAAESLFERGMQTYLSGDLSGARPLLSDARDRGADSVPTSFFLGVVRLLERDEEAALREFAVVLSRPPNAYTAESHYYSAKAWLRRANADSALAHLRAAAAIEGPFAPAVRALADTVLEVKR